MTESKQLKKSSHCQIVRQRNKNKHKWRYFLKMQHIRNDRSIRLMQAVWSMQESGRNKHKHRNVEQT